MLRRAAAVALVIGLLLPASAVAHSRYWERTHPWVGTGWKQDALCVHHYEGSWVDPYDPYFGGFQMDRNFQLAYGPWQYHHLGTANHWSKNGQLFVAWKGWKVRGWSPWPATAAMCGLL